MLINSHNCCIRVGLIKPFERKRSVIHYKINNQSRENKFIITNKSLRNCKIGETLIESVNKQIYIHNIWLKDI